MVDPRVTSSPCFLLVNTERPMDREKKKRSERLKVVARQYIFSEFSRVHG